MSTAGPEFLEGTARVDPGLCTACGACLKPAHCDAVVMEDRKARILTELCIGCGICESLCKFDAIRMYPA